MRETIFFKLFLPAFFNGGGGGVVSGLRKHQRKREGNRDREIEQMSAGRSANHHGGFSHFADDTSRQIIWGAERHLHFSFCCKNTDRFLAYGQITLKHLFSFGRHSLCQDWPVLRRGRFGLIY